MTAISRTPTNVNILHPNKFLLTFARMPNMQYFCQSVGIPGLSTSEIPITNPFVEIYAPGEKAIYDVLNITFFIDEQMLAWFEVHDWIRALTFPKEFEEYQRLGQLNRMASARAGIQPQYSDGSITILSSSNTPYYRFNFYDLFPISISSFVLNAADSPDTPMTADGTFRYSYYDVEKLF